MRLEPEALAFLYECIDFFLTPSFKSRFIEKDMTITFVGPFLKRSLLHVFSPKPDGISVFNDLLRSAG
jgi:hypothetical protein